MNPDALIVVRGGIIPASQIRSIEYVRRDDADSDYRHKGGTMDLVAFVAFDSRRIFIAQGLDIATWGEAGLNRLLRAIASLIHMGAIVNIADCIEAAAKEPPA